MAATTPALDLGVDVPSSDTRPAPAPVIAGSLTIPGQTRKVAEARAFVYKNARPRPRLLRHRRFTVL